MRDVQLYGDYPHELEYQQFRFKFCSIVTVDCYVGDD